MQQFRRKTDVNSKCQNFFVGIKNNIHFLIFFIVLTLVIGTIIATCPKSYNLIDNEKNNVFANEWQYSVDDGEFSSIALPFAEKQKIVSHITLKNRIPSDTIKGATVLIRTSQQNVEVFVEEESIYNSNGTGEKPYMPASSYHFVRLPVDTASKEITVVLSSPYERFAGLMNQICIGSKASNIFYLIHIHGFRFIIGFIIFIIGFLLMFAFLFAKRRKNTVGIVYLGAFFTCAGFWVLAESKIAQFVFPYPIAITNLSIFAMSLLPVFFSLYYHHTNKNQLRKLEKYMILVMGLVSLGMATAAVVNPMIPLAVLPLYLVLLGVYVIVTFTSITVDNLKGGVFFSASIWGILAFGSCCLFELVVYLSNLKGYNNSSFMTFGLFLFCIMMLVDVTQNFTKAYQDSIAVKSLKVLAYTDSLTGLPNRTAFLERMASLNMKEMCFVSIAMFDINNLKCVNDTLGHLVGDAMIKHSVHAIQGSIREMDTLYRIGGDEFVAIICHDQVLNYETLENRLVNMVQKESLKVTSYELKIAYGYETFSEDIDKDLFSTLARADVKMYECKKEQKCVR